MPRIFALVADRDNVTRKRATLTRRVAGYSSLVGTREAAESNTAVGSLCNGDRMLESSQVFSLVRPLSLRDSAWPCLLESLLFAVSHTSHAQMLDLLALTSTLTTHWIRSHLEAGRQTVHPLPSTIVDRIEGSLIFRITVPRRMRGEQVYLPGCGLLMNTSVIEKMGLLYSGYFAYYEETEYCLRCAKAGIKLVSVPTALLWHKGGVDTTKVPGFASYYGARNRFLFVARNSNVPGILLYFMSFVFLIGPLQLVLRVLRNDPRSLITYCRGACAGMRYVLTNKDRQHNPVDLPL